MVVSIQQMLFSTRAKEDDDLIKHTNKLKTYWEQINAFDIPEYNVSDVLFKGIITGSLSPSWDSFTAPYMNQYKNLESNDERKNIDSQTYIGIIQEEYFRCKAHKDGGQSFVMAYNDHGKASSTSHNSSATKNLKDHISGETQCSHCSGRWHTSETCYFKGKERCKTCQKFHNRKCHYENKEGNSGRIRKKKGSGGKKQDKKHQPVQNSKQAQIVIQRDPQDDKSDEEFLSGGDNPYGDSHIYCSFTERHCFSTTEMSNE